MWNTLAPASWIPEFYGIRINNIRKVADNGAVLYIVTELPTLLFKTSEGIHIEKEIKVLQQRSV